MRRAFIAAAAILGAVLALAAIAAGAPAAQAPSGARAAPYRLDSPALPSLARAELSLMTVARVTRVVDGDTVKVSIAAPPAGVAQAETVRLIGVDSPESVKAGTAVQRFAKEASAWADARLRGRVVRLAFDRALRDRYGRLLAYLFLEDGTCFDLDLVERGYGVAYLKYRFAFMEEFSRAEARARAARLGLWGG